MTGAPFDSEESSLERQLLEYKNRLERDRDRSISLREAAREWVRDYARHFRRKTSPEERSP